MLGVQDDENGTPEYVTVPCFASPRLNRNAPADLTQQSDPPNVQKFLPVAGQEVDQYFGCWLNINQQEPDDLSRLAAEQRRLGQPYGHTGPDRPSAAIAADRYQQGAPPVPHRRDSL